MDSINTTHRIMFSDTRFFLEENVNYPKGQGNLFLVAIGDFPFTGCRCIGGVDKTSEGWEVIVSKPYDETNDSDAQIVGYYETQIEAARALWRLRHSIEVE
jgi:hypothetical protein